MNRNRNLHVLLAALFAVFAWLSPAAAQPPPQVPGVQLDDVPAEAGGSYTMNSSSNPPVQASITNASAGKVTSFTITGSAPLSGQYRWDPNTNRYYKSVLPPALNSWLEFHPNGDGSYTYLYKEYGLTVDSGTANPN